MSNNFKIWLYKSGNEYPNITGNWMFLHEGAHNGEASSSKQSDHLFLNAYGRQYETAYTTVKTQKTIPMSGIKNIYFTFKTENGDMTYGIGGDPNYTNASRTKEGTGTSVTNITKSLSVSDIESLQKPFCFISAYNWGYMKAYVYSIWMESDDVVNIENQTQESITFSVNTTVSTVTINKVKLMANNNVLAEYSENFGNVTFNFIEESMEYGDNIISVQVEYTQGDGVSDVATCESNTIYRREVKLEEFQPFTDLHLNVSLEDIIYRINEVNEVHKAMALNLINILDSKGIVVNENSRLSELINLTVNLTNTNSQEITNYINQIAELEHQKNNLIAELAGKVTPVGTAVAADVLTGKTFINSTGQTITGTMANKGTKTFTPKATAQSADAGYYTKVTCKGDANLVAANIVSGKSIFGVTGTATVSSLGGFNVTFKAGTTVTLYGVQGNTLVQMTTTFTSPSSFKWTAPWTGTYSFSVAGRVTNYDAKFYFVKRNASGTEIWRSSEATGSIQNQAISMNAGESVEAWGRGTNVSYGAYFTSFYVKCTININGTNI